MFDRGGWILGRIAQVFGTDVANDLLARLDGVRWQADVVMGDQFETMLQLVERQCADSVLVRSVLGLIQAASESSLVGPLKSV
jgi:hypothetical protein